MHASRPSFTPQAASGFIESTKLLLSATDRHLEATVAVAVLITGAPWLQVKRDTQIDCALAELYQQGKATAKLAASVRQSDTMQAVFSRLNEMEDMLTLAQHVSTVRSLVLVPVRMTAVAWLGGVLPPYTLL